MLCHYQEAGHCVALSFSDLSVWCFACDSYLDVRVIVELRPFYEVAHLLKFGERPPFRSLEVLDLRNGESGSSSSKA
uniref:UBP-type domain-containing protein n=1 Tax=Arundo donax TaxID=35708 RepID=A0A0A8YAC0_ARUDO